MTGAHRPKHADTNQAGSTAYRSGMTRRPPPPTTAHHRPPLPTCCSSPPPPTAAPLVTAPRPPNDVRRRMPPTTPASAYRDRLAVIVSRSVGRPRAPSRGSLPGPLDSLGRHRLLDLVVGSGPESLYPPTSEPARRTLRARPSWLWAVPRWGVRADWSPLSPRLVASSARQRSTTLDNARQRSTTLDNGTQQQARKPRFHKGFGISVSNIRQP